MKKSLKIFALAASLLQAALFSSFAANPPSDFKYELTKDNKAVKITGVRNDKAEYVIPASIEDFPVKYVSFFIGENWNTSITPPDGCVGFSLSTSTYKNTNAFVNIKRLPAGIERVYIVGDFKSHIKLDQSLSELKNLKSLRLDNVDLVDKSVSIGCSAILTRTNVEELIFEEGVTEIGYTSSGHSSTFRFNKNLKRVVLPSTLKKVVNFCFLGCPNISEVVVPDYQEKILTIKYSEDGLEFYADSVDDIFNTTSLSLKNRIKLQAAFGFSQ